MATSKKDETSSSQASQTPETKPATPPAEGSTTSAAKQPTTSKSDEPTQEVAEQPATKQDETIPGGLYISGDRVVNAEGKEVKGYSISKDGKSIQKSTLTDQLKDI